MLEPNPRNVDSVGNLKVWYLDRDDVTDPSALEASALDNSRAITYSMPPGGYNRTETEATQTDPREGKVDEGEAPGAITNSVEITYFYGRDEDVLAPLVVKDEEGYIVDRRSIPNAAAAAAGQKVDVLAGYWGKPRSQPPNSNPKQIKMCKFYVTQVFNDVVLV